MCDGRVESVERLLLCIEVADAIFSYCVGSEYDREYMRRWLNGEQGGCRGHRNGGCAFGVEEHPSPNEYDPFGTRRNVLQMGREDSWCLCVYRPLNKCLVGRWQRIGVILSSFRLPAVLDLIEASVLQELTETSVTTLPPIGETSFSVDDLLDAEADVHKLLSLLCGGVHCKSATPYFHLWRTLIRDADAKWKTEGGDYRYNPLKHGREQREGHDDLLVLLLARGACLPRVAESTALAAEHIRGQVRKNVGKKKCGPTTRVRSRSSRRGTPPPQSRSLPAPPLPSLSFSHSSSTQQTLSTHSKDA